MSGFLAEASLQAPLRFAAVQLQRDGAGTVADEHGYFELESTAPLAEDSLLVFHGNRRAACWVDDTRSTELRVAVPPVLRVERARSRHSNSSPAFPPAGAVPVRATWGIPGTCYAFRVRNEAPARRGTLRTASFYIGDGALPREVFRVRVFGVAGEGPGQELLTEVVLLYAPRNSAWHTVDLTPYHLAVPNTGYFVGLEYIVDEGLRGSYFSSILADYTPTGPFMRPVYEANGRNAWSYGIGAGWARLPLDNGLFGRYGAMMKLEVDLLK